MSDLRFDRAQDIVAAFSEQRILVVGDLMLDRFIYGDVSRISPEAPVPVVQVRDEKYMPGGASNVAWNVQSLGGQSVVAGFIGADDTGAELRRRLEAQQVATDAVMALDSVDTTVKTRVIADNQQVVRVDRDHDLVLSDDVLADFCAQVVLQVENSSGVVIEDYGKGVVSQQVVDAVVAAARAANVPVAMDPKDGHELSLAGISVATPNRQEAFLAAGVRDCGKWASPLEDAALNRVCSDLLAKWQVDLLLVTLAADGMLVCARNGEVDHIPTMAREVFDVSGAGDTVVAVSLMALAAGASHVEAAALANSAAGVVVGKLGTAPCSSSELLAACRLAGD